MPGRSSNTGNPNDNYKFTGYELDNEASLNVYFANARMMDPVLGRFMQVDPFFDLYPGQGTYNYALNNPIFNTDPTGRCPEDGSEGINPNDNDGYCLAEIEVTATQLPWQVTIHYERPNYLAAYGAFAVRTAPITQADGAVLPFADAFYTGLLLGKLGTTVFDALTFDDQVTHEVMLPRVSNSIGVEKVPDLTGKTKEEVGDILTEIGFENRGLTEGGYQKWYHPDGSRIQVRPNGEVIRTGEKLGPNRRQRYGKDGKKTNEHNTGEKIKN